MSFDDLKRILAAGFIICAAIIPGFLVGFLWLMPAAFRQLDGTAITGYFTLAESAALIIFFMSLGQSFALCLFHEFCADENSQAGDSFSRSTVAEGIEALRRLDGRRGYLWFCLPLAAGALAFYATALLIDLYLDLGAGTLLLAFIALATLGAALIIFFGLPCVMQVREMADPAAILAQASRQLQGRRQLQTGRQSLGKH